jgi:hypothetical protein
VALLEREAHLVGVLDASRHNFESASLKCCDRQERIALGVFDQEHRELGSGAHRNPLTAGDAPDSPRARRQSIPVIAPLAITTNAVTSALPTQPGIGMHAALVYNWLERMQRNLRVSAPQRPVM